MPACNQKIARRVSRLMLAAILLLNTAGLGAMELQSSLLAQLADDSAPCHMTQTADHHHDEHALGCDSLCAQCTGFIPGICATPDDRVATAIRFLLKGVDPMPHFGSPLFKPPRA